ncbi:uncharacterized protein DS421_15g499550 [Arachis hypogaea]|nr:uncharacterized protein DS421_15g499550 [Arachis hypogaea]
MATSRSQTLGLHGAPFSVFLPSLKVLHVVNRVLFGCHEYIVMLFAVLFLRNWCWNQPTATHVEDPFVSREVRFEFESFGEG